MREKELFERAVGADEPPVRVDFDEIEHRGRRALRRRRAVVPGVAAAVTVVALSGGLFLATGSGEERSGQVPVAAGPTSGTAGSGPPRATDLRSAAPDTRDAAYCYRTADIGSNEPDQHVLVGVSGDDANGRGDVVSRIVDICRTAWKNNYYGWHPEGSGLEFPVPQLVACVLGDAAVDAKDGAVAVFPGTPQTCAELGLPVAVL